MEVYRYLTMDEILDYVNGRFEKIGRVYAGKNASNSHRYKPNTPYVHFFKTLKDLEAVKRAVPKDGEMLIAKFDIPFLTLVKHMGVGYYEPSGYDTDCDVIREFAIPTSKLKREFLISCAKDKNGLMTSEQAEESLRRFEQLLREHRAKKREARERGEE